jgi:hypothetical protein
MESPFRVNALFSSNGVDVEAGAVLGDASEQSVSEVFAKAEKILICRFKGQAVDLDDLQKIAGLGDDGMVIEMTGIGDKVRFRKFPGGNPIQRGGALA